MSSTVPAEVRTHLIDALQLDLVGPLPTIWFTPVIAPSFPTFSPNAS